MAVYEWRPGSFAPKIDPQIAGEELERLRVHHNGRLESRTLVEASRPTGAPLHDAFEWDDSKAGEAWRAEQAGQIIRSISIRVDRGGVDAPVRAFVSVKRDADRSYTSTLHALADADLRQQVLDQALKELEAWRQRHAELTELARVFAAIDEARGAE